MLVKKNEYLEKNKKIGDAKLWTILVVLDIANKIDIGRNILVAIFYDL